MILWVLKENKMDNYVILCESDGDYEDLESKYLDSEESKISIGVELHYQSNKLTTK